MEMEDVEDLGGLRHALQHQMIERQPVDDAAIEPQALPTHRRQPGARYRIAAGEERDVVAERDEFLGETRHDPLRPAVEFWRHGLVEGGNLGNSHGAYDNGGTLRKQPNRSDLSGDNGMNRAGC